MAKLIAPPVLRRGDETAQQLRQLIARQHHHGQSSRSLARLFLKETGTSFSTWRQHTRLMLALPRLAAGEPVTRVALDLGYASPSAFTRMFRRVLGVSPSEYLDAQG